MDSKGRVSVPSRYRDVLEKRQDRQLVLTNFGGYILAFPESDWDKLETKLAEQPLFRKDLRNFQRLIIAGAEYCPLDRQGRILLSQNLRDYAKLNKEVVIVGAVRCFEIWDKAAFEAHRKQLEESINQEVLDELMI